MYISQMEKDFGWLKKIIDSVSSFGQIESCENLIELFKKRNWSEDFTTDEENGYKSFVESLEQHLEKKIKRYGID
jgi:hypothetical protein